MGEDADDMSNTGNHGVWHDRHMHELSNTANAKPRASSAGVAVVRKTRDGWRLLVLRAYGKWDFPKGTLEPDETPFQAVIRETGEEASITPTQSLASQY
jgi:8-oxo-dGTP pyrophosphatase MutT (NUDIX family)